LTDYQVEGRYLELDPVRLAQDFPAYVVGLVARSDPDVPQPPGVVPETILWYVNGTEYLGRISIRHRLTPRLREIGGHIGYEVAAARRGRGRATRDARACPADRPPAGH
jgi:predicted acetyltransferase